MKPALILAFALLTLAPPLIGQAADARIQIIEYDADRIVSIRGALGYQLMLELDPAEHIENVSIGDAMGWQVTPNRRANVLFLKPIDGTATNMTVVTDLRRYVFDLDVQPKAVRTPAPYTIRFSYPQPLVLTPAEETPVAVEAPPTIANSAYSVTGSKENAPTRVFDDGRMTYFEWPADGALPAIFAVAPDGAESIVNYVVKGSYVVVEQISGRFSLRNGAQIATVTNDAYAGASPTRKSR